MIHFCPNMFLNLYQNMYAFAECLCQSLILLPPLVNDPAVCLGESLGPGGVENQWRRYLMHAIMGLKPCGERYPVFSERQVRRWSGIASGNPGKGDHVERGSVKGRGAVWSRSVLHVLHVTLDSSTCFSWTGLSFVFILLYVGRVLRLWLTDALEALCILYQVALR